MVKVKERLQQAANNVVDAVHNRMLTNLRSMDTRQLLMVLWSVGYDVNNGKEDLRETYNRYRLEYAYRRRRSAERSRKLLNR